MPLGLLLLVTGCLDGGPEAPRAPAAPERSCSAGAEARTFAMPEGRGRRPLETRAPQQRSASTLLATPWLGTLADQRASLAQAYDRYVTAATGGGFLAVGGAMTRVALHDRHPEVATLRARLAAEGYACVPPEAASVPEWFDTTTSDAVKVWQRDHDLEPTGLVDKKTLRELNVPAAHRGAQVLHALNHLDETLATSPQARIRVNIPAFEYTLYESDAELMRGRVIVGAALQSRAGGMTPEMQGAVSTFVAHPPWIPTRSYIEEKLLPAERRHPGTIARRGLQRTRGADGRTWYTQAPGPNNPLGRLEMRFNEDSVYYLHGTPDTHLFDRSSRAYSSGCVRVDEVENLGRAIAWLGGLDVDRLDRALSREGRTRVLAVPKPVPVTIEYVTADVGPDGHVRFHPDVYGIDSSILPSIQVAGF